MPRVEAAKIGSFKIETKFVLRLLLKSLFRMRNINSFAPIPLFRARNINGARYHSLDVNPHSSATHMLCALHRTGIKAVQRLMLF